jgi:hypothetical protein
MRLNLAPRLEQRGRFGSQSADPGPVDPDAGGPHNPSRLTPGRLTLTRAAPTIPSSRAVDALRDLIDAHAEVLELRSGGEESWSAVNVTRVVDVMDEEASEARYHEPGGVMTLDHLVLRPPLPPIFKLPQWAYGSALITQEVVDAAAEHQLTGLDPRPLTRG